MVIWFCIEYDDLQLQEWVKKDEAGNYLYSEFDEQFLRQIIDSANFKHTGIVDKDELIKLTKEAVDEYQSKNEDGDVGVLFSQAYEALKTKVREENDNIVGVTTEPLLSRDFEDTETMEEDLDGEGGETSLNSTRAGETVVPHPQKDSMDVISSPVKKQKESFYVVIALKHRLQETRNMDSDLISRSNVDRSRILILEMNPDSLTTCTEKNKDTKSKSLWMKLIRTGQFRGVEGHDIYDKVGFVSTINNLLQRSRKYYENEKKLSTTETLMKANKTLKHDKHKMETKIKDLESENQRLLKLLKDVHQLSGTFQTKV